jgi:hypothetical protein
MCIHTYSSMCSLYLWTDALYLNMRHSREHNKVCQGHLERKRETPSKREMVWFLYDGMITSSLSMRIEEVATSTLRSSRIGSVLTVVYLQPSDSRRLTVQETQHKCLDTLDVIGVVICR